MSTTNGQENGEGIAALNLPAWESDTTEWSIDWAGRLRAAKKKAIHFAEHLDGPPAGACGWVDRPSYVDQELDDLPHPLLGDTEYYRALRAESREHQDIMPWTLEEKALGRILRAHYQRRGTCVSQGYARGVQFTALTDMVVRNQGEEWIARVHPGSIYGASRVEVGSGRLGRGDGSLGSWAIQAVRKYGVLYRIRYESANGSVDLTADQDELYSVEWGLPGRGVPDVLEPAMREHIIEDGALVRTGEEYLECAYDWRWVPICSSRGFTTTRDQYGFCYPRGTWNHCMLAAGILAVKHPRYPSGRLGVPVYQSWGQNNPAGNARVTLQTGQEITLPTGVFLSPIEVLNDDILPARDSFVLTGHRGWIPTPSEDRRRLAA